MTMSQVQIQAFFITLGIFACTNSGAAGKIENILLNPKGNSIISPLSIQSTLVPLLIGSDGVTKRELTEFLNNDFDKPQISEDVLSPAPGQTLQLQGQHVNSVTALFTSLPLTRHFVKAATSSSSKTKIHLYENFNFTTNSGDINELVNTVTNGVIKNIVQEGSLSDDTKLIVVNAVHFKANWRQPFESISALQPFYTNQGKVIQIPMMTQRSTNYYGVVPALEAKIVEIPYENGEFIFRVILPTQRNGLPQVLERLKTFDYDTLNLKLTEVNTILPKFRISNELDLHRIFKNSGLPTLFSPLSANLPKLAIRGLAHEDGNLFVDKLISKAIVEVSPIGTEAGSATAAFIVPLSGLQTFDDFAADHPFVFQIVSTKDKSAIFSGTFVQPPSLLSTGTAASTTQPSKLHNESTKVTGNPNANTPPSTLQQETFYLNNADGTLNGTLSTPPWWVFTGTPVYLQPSPSPVTENRPQPSVAVATGEQNQTHPRFQQPEPTHVTGIRFPFPLTDPSVLFVLHPHRNTTSTNTI